MSWSLTAQTLCNTQWLMYCITAMQKDIQVKGSYCVKTQDQIHGYILFDSRFIWEIMYHTCNFILNKYNIYIVNFMFFSPHVINLFPP